MRKAFLTLLCMAAMLAAGTNLKAQEVSITLIPGWTWISNPSTDTLDFATALGSFTPMTGDAIKSQWGNAYYRNDHWAGSISQFYPGYGYKYYSNRTMPVTVTFNAQQPAPQVVVTTLEPTDITQNSAICGGNVVSSNGDYVSVTLRGICWNTNPNPTVNDNYIEAGNGLGSFTISMTELLPSTDYYIRAFAVTGTETFYGEEFSFTTFDHDRVDLGLPSGTLWATCNIGAFAPWASGSYFSWGETEQKENYDWSTYQYCNGSENTLTKYCNDASYGNNGFIDSLSILQFSDDAATVIWGTNWRTPTNEDWQELLDNTTHTWTTTSNGTKGFIFRGSNGNSIFLPVTDTRPSSTFPGNYNNGHYWSSSLGIESPNKAGYFTFYSQACHIDSFPRYFGLAIRPVRSATQNPPLIINATANPAEGGVVSGGGSYQAGAECTLTATANEGYTFTSWTENDSVASTDAAYTFTVTNARNLVANFEPIPTVNVYAWVSTKKIIADDITPELVSTKQHVSVPETSTGLTYGIAIPEGAVSGNGRVLVAIPKSFQYGSITDDVFFNTPTIGDAISHLDTYASNEINLTINGTQVPYMVVESISVPLQGASLDVVFGNVTGNSWSSVWSGTSGRRIPCEVYTNGSLVYP